MQTALLLLKNIALQFIVFFGVFAIGGAALTYLARWTNNVFRQFVFPNFGMYVFGVVGVPVHEFCHAFFCKVFLHDVKKVKWFDPKAKGGAHGSVTHAYNSFNLYHRIGHFFIGLGPVILAPVILAGLFYFLVPGGRSVFGLGSAGFLQMAKLFFSAVFSKAALTSIGFWVFLYLALAISSQMELSLEDLKQARAGILPLLLVLLILNLIAHLFGANWHGRALEIGATAAILWSCVFSFAAILSSVNLLICTLLMGGLNRAFGREPINPFR